MSKNNNNKEVKVLIQSLEKMETIVSKNKTLSWDGWNVVELIKNPAAFYKQNGAFIENVWYVKKVFYIGHDGWRIPNRYVE